MEEAESCKIGKLAVMSLSVVAGVKIPDLLFWKGKKKKQKRRQLLCAVDDSRWEDRWKVIALLRKPETAHVGLSSRLIIYCQILLIEICFHLCFSKKGVGSRLFCPGHCQRARKGVSESPSVGRQVRGEKG